MYSTHWSNWRCILSKSKDQIAAWKTLSSRVTHMVVQKYQWDCKRKLYRVSQVAPFSCCGYFSNFAIKKSWHCHRDLYSKRYLLNCLHFHLFTMQLGKSYHFCPVQKAFHTAKNCEVWGMVIVKIAWNDRLN